VKHSLSLLEPAEAMELDAERAAKIRTSVHQELQTFARELVSSLQFYQKPELVVCAVIENGGYGGEVAAPSALQVFERYFGTEAASVDTKQAD
jgi:cell division protein FtsI/penicillin-binding protein 2